MATEGFNYTNCHVLAYGVSLESVTKLEGKVSQAKSLYYGKGKKPLRVVRGKKEYEGSIKLDLYEIRELLNKAGKGYDLTDLAPDDWTLTYLTEKNDMMVDILQGVEFLESPFGWGEEAENIDYDIPIIFWGIKKNAA